MKVFVSYSHQQDARVRDDLAPLLEDNVLIDHKLFNAGRTIVGQMGSTQDQADRQVLWLWKAYAASDMCRHEFQRATAVDPGFQHGCVLPLCLDGAPLPPEIADPDPIWLNLDEPS
jgi:TIR domain